MCHTAMNIAATNGPSTKPLMPNNATPPSVDHEPAVRGERDALPMELALDAAKIAGA